MTTVGQSNDKGSWSGLKFDITGMVEDRNMYEIAKQFHELVKSGEAKADFSKADQNAASGEATSNSPSEAESF